MDYYPGTWFEYHGREIHPDVVKLAQHAFGRDPTGYEREQLRERVKAKLAFMYTGKVQANEENLKRIDELLKELAQELKQEHKRR